MLCGRCQDYSQPPAVCLGVIKDENISTQTYYRPTNTYPMYNPYIAAEFLPLRQELETNHHNYPAITCIATNQTTAPWCNLETLIDEIDTAWDTCGHHRLLFSIIYLAFPTIRPYIRLHNALPSHLLTIH